jgi:hypothetical protein
MKARGRRGRSDRNRRRQSLTVGSFFSWCNRNTSLILLTDNPLAAIHSSKTVCGGGKALRSIIQRRLTHDLRGSRIGSELPAGINRNRWPECVGIRTNSATLL